MIEEYAIAVGELFEALPHTHLAHVLLLEVLDAQAGGLGQGRNLRFVHPNVSRRSGATVAASGTLEPQSIAIPGIFFHQHDIPVGWRFEVN
jgi:hypothetical protein